MRLRELELMVLYGADETAGSEGVPATDNTERDNGGQAEDTEAKFFRTFETEEDFNKVIKSAQSKAKLELMKEAGVSNAKELSELVGKGKQVDDLQTKLQALEYDNALISAGIADEYKNEALTLAKAKAEKEEITIQEAIKGVVEKFPNMINAGKANFAFGAERKTKQMSTDEQLRNSLAAKFPFLK